MFALYMLYRTVKVAPARERGLKYANDWKLLGNACRSREGAWIEIMNT